MMRTPTCHKCGRKAANAYCDPCWDGLVGRMMKRTNPQPKPEPALRLKPNGNPVKTWRVA